MIVRSFLKWFENAAVDERVEAARYMIRAYLDDQLGSESRADAEAALTLVLDDPSILVRRALAWDIAASDVAPRHIVVALAQDVSEVGAPVLARSPLLRDPDLIDCVAIGDRLSHLAIAMRNEVSLSVSSALAELAGSDALVALLRNPGAEIGGAAFARMLGRHAECGQLREALGAREDLPSPVRQQLLSSLSSGLLKFVSDAGWMGGARAERIIGETREAATIDLASHANDLDALVEHLRASSQLTPALLLRSLLSGETALFGAAIVALTGFKPARVDAIISSKGQAALPALYQKAGLPNGLYPAFSAALFAILEQNPVASDSPRLNRRIIQCALGACLEHDETEMQPLLGLLRRFDAEAARLDARALTSSLMTEAAPMLIDSQLPVDLDAMARALAIDFDRPFTARELETAPMLDVDLDLLGAELILEDALFGDGFGVKPIEQLASDVDDLTALINQTFGRIPETRDEDLVALRVIESPAASLDESFFSGWEIRRRAA